MKKLPLICDIIRHVPSLLILTFFIISGCENRQLDRDLLYEIPPQPEMATGYTPKPGWEFSEFAVAAANPLATDAGYQILQAGGSAMDAAIAVQMVLSLAEPQSSGIGGGAFVMHWDGQHVSAYNGREAAPSGADEYLFYDDNGEELSFSDAVASGLSVGVPGTVAVMKIAHEKHGNLPWSDLFTPAITLAREGFAMSPRLNRQLQYNEELRNDPIARALYYDEAGDAHPVGYTVRNPALAEVLERISEEGLSAFYNGVVAEDIVKRIHEHRRPGVMKVEDINRYPDREFERDPICTDWRTYRICGFPPPSSGHIAVMQILGIMAFLDAPDEALRDAIPTADWLHQFLEASKLAFADRNRYIGDSKFVDPPAGSWESMLAPDYLEYRAAQIGETSMGEADPGEPGTVTSSLGSQPFQQEGGTSHISIIDRDGNTVSMTTTIEQVFGSRIMSDGGTGLEGGFLLNNELTDFARSPKDDEGRKMANRVEPGKQPRSSMSPTLVFDRDSGGLVASVGSPGGAAIIHYTAKAIIGMLDWELNAQEAIDLPNFANYNGPSVLEEDRFPEETIQALRERDHRVLQRSLPSGLQAIQRTESGLFGGADPRREGVVMGQ